MVSHIINMNSFFICHKHVDNVQIMMSDFFTIAWKRFYGPYNRFAFISADIVSSLLILFCFSFITRYWLPRINGKHQRNVRWLIYDSMTMDAGHFIFILFYLWDKIEIQFCILRHSIAIGCRVLFRGDHFDASWRNRRDSHRSLLRSSVSPRHVQALIQLKRREQTRILEQSCWFEFVICTYTSTSTQTHPQTHSNYIYITDNSIRRGRLNRDSFSCN